MTIRSMTAFAHQPTEKDWGSFIWELRSVNHRYLDLSFKLPEAWRQIEPRLRDTLRKRLQRGKVECILRLRLDSSADDKLILNRNLAEQLLNTAKQLQQDIPGAAPINVLDVLQWPGVITQPDADTDSISRELLDGFEQTLDDFERCREREGAELKTMIEQRLSQITAITAQVRSNMPAIVAGQRQKLQQKLADLQIQLDQERLEAEVALLAQKIDVDEELDRLDTHVTEVQRVVTKGDACGRRLDFLMQELNREANTLSSKAAVSDSTQAAVELKVLIEQMREQIQNIE